MERIDRRNFLFASSGAAAGTLVAPGLLEGRGKTGT